MQLHADRGGPALRGGALNRAIDATPKGGDIRIARYLFDIGSVANTGRTLTAPESGKTKLSEDFATNG